MTNQSASVDWAEITRLHALSLNEDIEAFSRRNARELVWEMLYDAFPAIVARLEAAQRLRRTIGDYIETPRPETDLALAAAIAAFDKEQTE